MSKRILILGCLLFLGSIQASQAAPMDSPDIVYIDGVPCNRPCQDYMAWSRSVQSAHHQQPASEQSVQVPSNTVVRRATAAGLERSKPARRIHVAKHGAPASTKMPPTTTAKLQPPEKKDARSDNAQAKIGEPHPASEAAPGVDSAQEKIAKPSPAVEAAPGSNATEAKVENSSPTDKTASSSDAAQAKIADPSPASGAGGFNANALQAQVAAATAMALKMSIAPPAPEAQPKADDAERSDHAEAVMPGDADKTGSTPPTGADVRVALLMARPEIKSVSDLTDKEIAIDNDAMDNGQAASNDSILTAIAAAGATKVQLSEAQTGAVERVIAGDAPAAILALVSPQAAEAFPDIAGFRIFRIPLAPRSKARL